MNISKQIKNYRKKFNISQETLAEEIHVSRQTISNWENDKSYPDLQSLILLSDYFKTSLDELVKGDVVNMKNQLKTNEILNLSRGMIIGYVLMLLSFSLVFIFSPYFLILSLGIWVVTMIFAYKTEKIKNQNNLKTYKEILKYIETGEIPEEKKEAESLKIKMIKGILGTLLGGVAGYLIYLLF